MSKFHLFVFQRYEAAGGLNDLESTHDSIEDAERAILALDSIDDVAQITTIVDDKLALVHQYLRTEKPLLENGRLGYGKGTERWLREEPSDDVHVELYSELKVVDDTTR